jgi:predicted cupin superfamily sugar epimerase
MHPRAAELIESLALVSHPEGGYFSEIFRSSARVHPDDDRGERSALTTIHFLLTEGTRSRWHRLRSDEIWHHCEGDRLELFWLDEEMRECRCLVLGSVEEGGQQVAVVPAGAWQAARSTGHYTLVGCTVAPGFEFSDFEMLADDRAAADALAEWFSELEEFA